MSSSAGGAMPREMPAAESALPILFRDPYLVAVHKPSGLLVHRSAIDRQERRFLIQQARQQLGRRVYPVHRLDKGTSGVLLMAFDRDVARDAALQFAHREVGKTYLAVVRGHPPANGEIDHPLRAVDDRRDRRGDGLARDAFTSYRRLATIELPHRVDRYPTSRYALVELEPRSGRRHQLRRHLKHISHPIIGDATYGKGRHNRLFQSLFGCQRLLLACVELRLRHPIDDAPLVIQAPLATDFDAVVAALGWRGAWRG